MTHTTNLFSRAIRDLFAEEGGFVDDPLDPGGKTNRGITITTLNEALEEGLVHPSTTIDTITEEEAAIIYHAYYWDRARCDEFPPHLSRLVFDFAVNSGVSRAILSLQRSLYVEADGIVGPNTLEAASTTTSSALIRYTVERFEFIDEVIRRRPTSIKFLRGWRYRILRTLAHGLREWDLQTSPS